MSLHFESKTYPVVEARARTWSQFDQLKQEVSTSDAPLNADHFSRLDPAASEVADINNTLNNIGILQTDLARQQADLTTEQTELERLSKNSKNLTWTVLGILLCIILYIVSR